jgi:hypothetical protein
VRSEEDYFSPWFAYKHLQNHQGRKARREFVSSKPIQILKGSGFGIHGAYSVQNFVKRRGRQWASPQYTVYTADIVF